MVPGLASVGHAAMEKRGLIWNRILGWARNMAAAAKRAAAAVASAAQSAVGSASIPTRMYIEGAEALGTPGCRSADFHVTVSAGEDAAALYGTGVAVSKAPLTVVGIGSLLLKQYKGPLAHALGGDYSGLPIGNTVSRLQAAYQSCPQFNSVLVTQFGNPLAW